jgi:hypothetical protein
MVTRWQTVLAIVMMNVLGAVVHVLHWEIWRSPADLGVTGSDVEPGHDARSFRLAGTTVAAPRERRGEGRRAATLLLCRSLPSLRRGVRNLAALT